MRWRSIRIGFMSSGNGIRRNQTDVVTLANPNLVIDKRFNAGRHHGYLLTKTRSDFGEEDDCGISESAGPLILMDYHVPREPEAHSGRQPTLQNGTRATLCLRV